MTGGADYTAYRFWLDAGQMAAIIGLGIYSWWQNRERVTSKRFVALETDVARRATIVGLKAVEEKAEADLKALENKRAESCGRHKARTGQLEMEVRQLPARAEILALSSEIRGLSEKMGEFKGRLEGLNRLADLINEHLINKEK